MAVTALTQARPRTAQARAISAIVPSGAAGSRAARASTEPFAGLLGQRHDVPGRRTLATEER